MKNFFLFLTLLVVSQVGHARTHLDLNDGTVAVCKGKKGEANAIGFHAKITTAKQTDGGLKITVATEFDQCLQDPSGNKQWSTLTKPEASNYFGQMKFTNLRLLLTTEDGHLISLTPLKLEDTQTIQITAQQMKNLQGRALQLGALIHQEFFVDGSLQDSREQFYGSYLISHL